MATFQKTIECASNIRASLDEAGNFVLRARSRTAYADGAFVGAEVEVSKEHAARVREAMSNALDSVSEPLAMQADRNAAVALAQAYSMGEVK